MVARHISSQKSSWIVSGQSSSPRQFPSLHHQGRAKQIMHKDKSFTWTQQCCPSSKMIPAAFFLRLLAASCNKAVLLLSTSGRPGPQLIQHFLLLLQMLLPEKKVKNYISIIFQQIFQSHPPLPPLDIQLLHLRPSMVPRRSFNVAGVWLLQLPQHQEAHPQILLVA